MNINHLGTLRQFEILREVYKLGSISKAGEALNLSQPTISMQLKKLAQQHGVQLYDQIGKRLVFTEAGVTLTQSANAIMRELEHLQGQISSLHGLKKGTLRLAVVTSAKYFIPHILGAFCQRYPDIEIKLKIGNRENVVERLANAEDDFYVFSHVPNLRHIDAIEFLPNPLIPIVSANHPLTQKKNLKLKDLQPLNFIVREPGSGTRYAIDKYLAERNINFNIRLTIESNEAIRHCVMENLGFSVLSAHALSFGGDAGVARLQVEGFPITSQWSFVWPNEKALSPLSDVFLNYLTTEGHERLLDFV